MKTTINKKKEIKKELKNFVLNNRESINRINIKKYEDSSDIFIKTIKMIKNNKSTSP